MNLKRFLLLALLIGFTVPVAQSQTLPDSPIAKKDAPKKILSLKRIDTGWLTRAHLVVAMYDGATTGYGVHKYGWIEGDPVSRFFIGKNASTSRMLVFGGLEVVGVAMLPKKVRIPAQIALLTIHVVESSKNVHNFSNRGYF